MNKVIEKIPGELIHLTLIVLFIAGAFGVVAAGNVAAFATWLLIALTVLGVVVCDPKELFKKTKKKPHMKYLFAASIVVMAGSGWMVTAFFYLCAWVLLWGKKQMHLEELKEASS